MAHPYDDRREGPEVSLRARTRASDYLWGIVALVAAVGVIFLMIEGIVALVSAPTPGQFAVFVIGTVLIVGVGRWIILGAWRRTVWGAPEGGLRDLREHRHEARVDRS